MDHFNKLKKQVQFHIFLMLAFFTALVVAASWLARQNFPGNETLISAAALVVGTIIALALSFALTDYALKPLGTVWQAVLHISQKRHSTSPPNIYTGKVGKELVTDLALQVYQLASDSSSKGTSKGDQVYELTQTMVNNLPVPIFAVNKDQEIVFANEHGVKYLGLKSDDVIGQNVYSVLDLFFQDDNTFDNWLKNCRENKVTDTGHWERVRLKLSDQKTIRQFGMAASYSKENSVGVETVIALFDRTNKYNADDQALNFIALAVHELRTPLTVLRGYIEVFENELSQEVDDEMKDFIHKMNAASQQLTAFVNNILNVARVEDNQLTLQLEEGDWKEIVEDAVSSLELQCQVHGITLDCKIDEGLPKVAVDKVSIYEVINNLVDNAIKYSREGQKIAVRSHVAKDGLVETTIQDWGVGIPTSVMPYIFEKFERNHRNKAQIGGTGLGLYLSKSILNAHGGNIWVQSKEDQGSTFGFTLQPYDKLADELKNSDNKGITRGAHGWIKNHSLYRR